MFEDNCVDFAGVEQIKGLFGSIFRTGKVDGIEKIFPVVAQFLYFSCNEEIAWVSLGRKS